MGNCCLYWDLWGRSIIGLNLQFKIAERCRNKWMLGLRASFPGTSHCWGVLRAAKVTWLIWMKPSLWFWQEADLIPGTFGGYYRSKWIELNSKHSCCFVLTWPLHVDCRPGKAHGNVGKRFLRLLSVSWVRGTGVDLLSCLLRSSFQGYKFCSLNASLPHVQINDNYSLYCYAQGHKGMVNILFAFPSWIAPLTVQWDSTHYYTGNSKILTCNLQWSKTGQCELQKKEERACYYK